MYWKIPLFDPDLDEREIDAVASVVRSKWLTMGEHTAEFERRFAEFCGCGHAVAVNSATAAMHIALLAADVGPDRSLLAIRVTRTRSSSRKRSNASPARN